jgi:hypothetical protein
MKQYLFTMLTTVLLLLPVAAQATTQSSPNYTIDAGRIVSGGGAATDISGLSNSGIVIGQGVIIPPGGISSPLYTIKAAASATPTPGGNSHSGDINGDGKIDIIDALLALRATVGLTLLSAAEIVRGDAGPLVNGVPVGDDRIDILDTILILRKSVGLGW